MLIVSLFEYVNKFLWYIQSAKSWEYLFVYKYHDQSFEDLLSSLLLPGN